jgi:hypothetical protein
MDPIYTVLVIYIFTDMVPIYTVLFIYIFTDMDPIYTVLFIYIFTDMDPIYTVLVILRFVLVFIPQFGYIHPDEFFQTTEVVAGKSIQ